MKAFEISRVVVVAMIACLPIACGTSSPMGASGVDERTVSALRTGFDFAPEPNDPAPFPEPVPSPKPSPTTNQIPVPVPVTQRPTNLPTPSPAPTNNIPVPAPVTQGPTNLPPPSPAPTNNVAVPTPAPQVPSAVPPPPYPVPPTRNVCDAVAAEILILRGNLPQPGFREQVLLELAMIDTAGNEVKNDACRVAWSFGSNSYAAGATITVGADTRFASVNGQAGSYVIRATTANGVSATVGIVLQ